MNKALLYTAFGIGDILFAIHFMGYGTPQFLIFLLGAVLTFVGLIYFLTSDESWN